MNVQKNFINKLFYAVSVFILILFSGCSSDDRDVITVWTDRAEIVSYSEVFNAQNKKSKVVVIYKDKLAQSIPPAKDEVPPDVVIGAWLKNSSIADNYLKIDSIFTSSGIRPDTIYNSLLEYGQKNNQQYLIPLSFNLPMIIYASSNVAKTEEGISITPEKLKETAALYNKEAKPVYANMGFAPSWKSEFIYELAKLNNANFIEDGTTFRYNKKNLDKTIEYVKDWTTTKNTSTKAEQDFQFKYLYTPDYRQISFGPSLYAYTTSSSFFTIPSTYFEQIHYKWLSGEETIIVQDGIVMTGIYNSCENVKQAQDFIAWLVNENTQKKLLDRTRKMHLDKETFGIASGFSSVINVNETILPSYYENLRGHIPEAKTIQSPYSTFPSRWTSLKERVIIPYLADATKTDSTEEFKSMEYRIDTWTKQFN